ncbi:alpha-galactosidase [Microbacterium sp. C5A9]|uniref:glycoside hydrolase family 36 protein n=1 Tax=Microbacterium sp. C5A9 TaxID=2736663 RepID=UPI001F51884B|nr:glycoside hydrolase family 36 protein [Microbacterium sp. C5A9]MCI1018998.1 alpha-galactosidase [Microbacterium sp. C5A9]
MIARIGGLAIAGGSEGPVTLAVADGHPAALVEIFTAAEQRARTSQAYVRSALGSRLRLTRADVDADAVTLVQRDALTGLEVTSVLALSGTAVRVQHTLRGTAAEQVVVTAVSSATVGIGSGPHAGEEYDLLTARSEWLAENRWHRRALADELPPLSLPIHAQDGRGHATLTSHGAWSTGEHLPVGALVHRDGSALAWQIESGAGWHVDLSQGLEGLTLSLLGPTDLEHQFAHVLGQGDEFTAVPVALAASAQGLERAIASLTSHRRAIRRAARQVDGPDLPIVYNDFMNTLMGQPSSEALRPLITAAAEVGVEVFCIDAGWFADPAIGDWWDTVGEWQEAASRFDEHGLRGIIDQIHARGMRSGLWLEPEVVGVTSTVAQTLPDEAFFHRFGVRVREHDRYHLDFRHPAARAHVDETVDRLVRDYGVSFLKLDYNINPGAGTEWQAGAAGDGLLGHIRAVGDWLDDVQRRHPGLLIENCASGAMRADYALLSRTHLQSTTDQQDFRLYPPIAASAPASILPEQAGNWAYPAVGMTDAETAFTLVTGLSGRLYLSGFLGELRASQRALVTEAIALHSQLRDGLATTEPFWPLGLPAWDDDVVCLGLRDQGQALLFVWDRSEEPNSFTIPGAGGAETLFPAHASPAADGWAVESIDAGIRIATTAGLGARVLRVREDRA